MAEFIEREAVKKLICGFCNDCDGGADVCEYRDIQVDAIPAVDVRPVVTCSDCKSYNRPRLGFCETHLVRMHGDDFCSYGKKREES